MPGFAWIASFVFLGLSVSIGLLIYFLLYGKKKKTEEDLPPELKELNKAQDEETTLNDLERIYGKKGR